MGQPGGRRPKVILPKNPNGRSEVQDCPTFFVQFPLFSPIVKPLGISFKQANAGMTRWPSRQGKCVKGKAPFILEIEIPRHLPIQIIRALVTPGLPIQIEETGGRREPCLT